MANLPGWVSEAKPTGLLTTVIDKGGARQLDGKGLAAYMVAGLDDDQRKLAAWIRIAENITYDEKRLPPTVRAAIRRDAEREAYTRKVAAWARVVENITSSWLLLPSGVKAMLGKHLPSHPTNAALHPLHHKGLSKQQDIYWRFCELYRSPLMRPQGVTA